MIQQDKAVHSASGSTSNLYAAGNRWSASAVWALGLLLVLGALASQAQTAAPNLVGFSGMAFSNLPGPNLASYLGSTEGTFTLTPTAGPWFQSTFYGSPAPSISDGNPLPGGIIPGFGVVSLTAAGSSPFNFNSLDYSSNNGDTAYDIEGHLGGSLVFKETGTMHGTNTPAAFTTFFSSHSSAQVDALLIELTPLLTGDPSNPVFPTSINLDNINVLLVPEPGAAWLLGIGLMLAFCKRPLNRTSS
jgi:hypothetical protein